MKLKTGHVVADRYEIDDLIGSGGMSHVYRAHDNKLDRYVTLKVLKEDYLQDETFKTRFPEEARAAAALNHQNIVSIFDYGNDGDVWYIVLEYVDGASLKDLINKKAPFDNDTTLGVAIQVSEGLSKAHRSGIVHLDVKPQNILITSSSVVKVADFGIARVAKAATLNASSGSMGSVHYFSPEQARGGYIDHRSDIYSLGIVMYEMATGELPYDGDNEVAVALQHINEHIPDIKEKNPRVSDNIIHIIEKATAKSASQRYLTIDEMEYDLKRAISDEGHLYADEAFIDESVVSAKIATSGTKEKARAAWLSGEAYNDEDDFEDEIYEDTGNEKSDKVAIISGVLLGLLFVGIITAAILFIFPRLVGSGNHVSAPDVSGMTFDAAQDVASAHGLNLTVFTEEFSDTIPAGQIIRQIQMPGFNLAEGDVLQVYLSRGPEAEAPTMPYIQMLSLEEAHDRLQHFPVIVQIDFVESDTVPKDHIISQNPPVGTTITMDMVVTLTVSQGVDANLISVPNLIGTAETSALSVLRTHNLIAGLVTRVESTTYPQGTVILQNPMPNEMVSPGAQVTLTVSTGPPPMPSPTPTPAPTPTPTPDAETPTATPVPSPTPTPTPTPTPPANDETENGENDTNNDETPPADEDPPPTVEPVRRSLNISLWSVPAGTEYVHLTVTRQEGHNEPSILFNDPNVHVSRFPITLQVEGNGYVLFRFFSVENNIETLRFIEPVNFDE